MNKKVYIVGMGMDGKSTLTLAGKAAITEAEALAGAARLLAAVEQNGRPCLASFKSEEIAEFIKNCGHGKIAVLMSGDCGFYSGARKLLPLLSGIETEIIPSVASPVYFCARLGFSWEKLHYVSLHGRDGSIARPVASHEKTFFLLGGRLNAADICQRLDEYGLGAVKIYIGENLAAENERIISGSASELTNVETGSLSVLLAVNSKYEKGLRSCIPDSAFVRSKVPMTKAEVRGTSVSSLDVGMSDICWDIGAGTGSVSVEMALRCGGGRVYAVEKNSEAASLIDENRRAFACDNIEIINMSASETIKNLPSPDCVFIGGSGGELSKIISGALEKNPKAKITLTAISLETLSEAVELFKRHGLSADITQISVARTRSVGGYTMLNAQNPVFIISAGRGQSDAT